MLISCATSQSKLKGFSFDSGVLRIVSGIWQTTARPVRTTQCMVEDGYFHLFAAHGCLSAKKESTPFVCRLNLKSNCVIVVLPSSSEVAEWL